MILASASAATLIIELCHCDIAGVAAFAAVGDITLVNSKSTKSAPVHRNSFYIFACNSTHSMIILVVLVHSPN